MVTINDIVSVDFNEKEYVNILKKATIYAIESVPYTYDRFGYGNSIDGVRKRIEKIITGKFGEGCLERYCNYKSKNIIIEKDETPFWTYDNGDDFIINQKYKADLKNNLIKCEYSFDDILNFKALVPKKQLKQKNDFIYIFSFVSNCENFFELSISDDLIEYISHFNNDCSGSRLKKKPDYFISHTDFFQNVLFKKFGYQELVKLIYKPQFIICGYIDSKNFMEKGKLIEKNSDCGFNRSMIENYGVNVSELKSIYSL